MLFVYIWDCENCLVVLSSEVSSVQGYFSIEVTRRTVRTLELSVISWVSAVQGCLLSGVPLYKSLSHHTRETHSLMTGLTLSR